jgi:hypothetical protein
MTTAEEFPLLPIRELSRAEFIELRDHYLESDDGIGFPSLADALELIRRDLNDALHNTPLDAIAPGVRHNLAVLMDVATWALVMHRAADIT